VKRVLDNWVNHCKQFPQSIRQSERHGKQSPLSKVVKVVAGGLDVIELSVNFTAVQALDFAMTQKNTDISGLIHARWGSVARPTWDAKTRTNAKDHPIVKIVFMFEVVDDVVRFRDPAVLDWTRKYPRSSRWDTHENGWCSTTTHARSWRHAMPHAVRTAHTVKRRARPKCRTC
jgi:hypothetical protein